MKYMTIILFFLLLVGCGGNEKLRQGKPTVKHQAQKWELEDIFKNEKPIIRNGLTISHPNRKDAVLAAALLANVSSSMSTKEIVKTLGPGYVSPLSGIGMISWCFDNKKTLQVWPEWSDIDLKPKRYFVEETKRTP